jgi:DNA-binding response OmpR family regulator
MHLVIPILFRIKSIRRLLSHIISRSIRIMTKRIIIIDDSVTIRKLLSKKFTLDGYAVDTASDGEKGLKMLRAENYSAAILDYDMPKLNGLKLYLELRNEGNPVKDRVIFYTGKACSDFHKYLEKVKVPYLTKPAPLKKLREYVSAFCNEDE